MLCSMVFRVHMKRLRLISTVIMPRPITHMIMHGLISIVMTMRITIIISVMNHLMFGIRRIRLISIIARIADVRCHWCCSECCS